MVGEERKPVGNPVIEKPAGNPPGDPVRRNPDGEAPACPANPRWLKSMLDLFPVGCAGRLEKYRACVEGTPALGEGEAEGAPE